MQLSLDIWILFSNELTDLQQTTEKFYKSFKVNFTKWKH